MSIVRSIYLMRHAESKNNQFIHDRQRSLTTKGLVESTKAKIFLKNRQIDKVFVSNALRTQQTFNQISSAIPKTICKICDKLYQDSEDSLIEIISNQDNKFLSILFLGHNPTIYNLALKLSKFESSYYDHLFKVGMSTSQIIVISFKSLYEWSFIENNSGDITDIFIPDQFHVSNI